VWHCSVAPRPGKLVSERVLRLFAYHHLSGVGNSEREWIEVTPRAFHLRRQLTITEEAQIGPAVDCRGSEEARCRFEAVKAVLPPEAWAIALDEMKEAPQ
jgi:hypothetical protein